MAEADLLSDERLVGLTLEGDRDAFGQIVARYQSPICALAYSACGSITGSEDLAQEVFVAAWRRLRELKDPAKLKSWLYAIARNLINTAFRQQSRNPLSSAFPLEEAVETTEFCGPSETTISKEEEAILWQVLSGLPEVYRQPMVLFYRQEESIAGVAEILGISEEAVRQRLSRGRAMLNERVAKVVEMGLRRSGPSEAFGLAVLAALPSASIKVGTVGAATVAAKGASSVTGLGLLSVVGGIASGAGSVVSGLVALWGRVQNTRSARERKFARRTVWGVLALVLGFLVVQRLLLGLGVFRMSLRRFDTAACSLLWLAFLGPLFFFTIWRGRRQKQIQIEEGTAEARLSWWMWRLDPAGPGVKAATYGTLACLVFGACSWLMLSASQKEDRLVAVLLLVLCIAAWLLIGRAIMRRPDKTPGIFNAVWWGLAAVNLAVANLRWDAWFGGVSVNQFPSRLAPWVVDYWILFLFATVRILWWLRRFFLTVPDARPAARRAVAVYVGLLLSGFVLLALVK